MSFHEPTEFIRRYRLPCPLLSFKCVNIGLDLGVPFSPPAGFFLTVFLMVNMCFSADDLSSDMCLQGIAVQSLHGDREQCDREEALQDFKDGMH